MAKVFVTGGSGFLGRELIKELVRLGYEVWALARGEKARAVVEAFGAKPVKGDLDAKAEMKIAMVGADVVYHCAAEVTVWGDLKQSAKVNVDGTRNVIEAAREAHVPRVVHVSTEAVLVDGRPLVQVDEAQALPVAPLGVYPITKGAAERVVLAMNGHGIECVIVRPRFIWGKGDTTLLPNLIQAAKAGGFPFIGGGDHLTSTCHVRNVVEGMILAAQKGKPGEIYFLTDGPAVVFRRFITDLLATQGVAAGERVVPRWLAWTLAAFFEFLWSMLGLKSQPPLTRTIIALIGQEVTVIDAKARRELGYRSPVSHAHGLAELRVHGL